MIHWELCKKLKFHHTIKWYKHNPEHVLENDAHKILKDFEIQTVHLILVRKPDLMMINKNLKKENLPCIGPQSENQRKRKEKQVLGLK